MTVFHIVLMKCTKPKASILNIESACYLPIFCNNIIKFVKFKIYEISQKILYTLYGCIAICKCFHILFQYCMYQQFFANTCIYLYLVLSDSRSLSVSEVKEVSDD